MKESRRDFLKRSTQGLVALGALALMDRMGFLRAAASDKKPVEPTPGLDEIPLEPLEIPSEPLEEKTYYLPIVERDYHPVWPGKGVGGGNCSHLAILKPKWNYVWGPGVQVCPGLGIDHVPMNWGLGHVGLPLGGNSDCILIANEPADPAQLNISPSEGVGFWWQAEQAYPNLKLVGPNVLLCFGECDYRSRAFNWLNEWYGLFIEEHSEEGQDRPPRIDALGIHAYGTFEDCRTAIIEANEWAEAHGIKDVWLTEFAYLPCWEGGMNASVEFMNSMFEWLSTSPEAEKDKRAAHFMTSYTGEEPWSPPLECNTSLIDWDTGELSPLGHEFLRW